MKVDVPLIDSYNRIARLYPALLVLAPIAWTASALTPGGIFFDLSRAVGSSFSAVAASALLVNIVRSCGKTREHALLAEWGGWRTTVLLRHRDGSIDPHTKARYHAQLQALCPGLTLPTTAAEIRAPDEADDKYRSATKRLIEQRRDRRYSLLHKENAQYGFRRNLLGVKPLALTVAGFSLSIGLTFILKGLLPIANLGAIFSDAALRWPLYALVAGDLAYALVWVTVVRVGFVLQAADEYAVALFRTLEELPVPRRRASKRPAASGDNA